MRIYVIVTVFPQIGVLRAMLKWRKQEWYRR